MQIQNVETFKWTHSIMYEEVMHSDVSVPWESFLNILIWSCAICSNKRKEKKQKIKTLLS